DPSFPRYPRLPVVACAGHRPRPREEAPAPPIVSTVEEPVAAAELLHITNGDAVLACFRAGGIGGEQVAWRDSLHDGPVPWTETIGGVGASSRGRGRCPAHATTGSRG
ncbi:MAG TPA: hypothetical protein VN923_01535, partial [Thermoanaerobaculia bacterium]|nr:hypothetical protein [Thermoanaerobaculia bacterium]